ncbi:Rab-like protein 6 [Tritrichomonas musculus]|uniref:Rab-like protein 6 n=1 Tax=Tritrichomonas musculus TaxID=1915356 RepID=A0ABR2GPQ6_9EUKA
MGNEQGSPYLQQKQQQQSSKPGSSPYDFESLIVIRGERRTGKSTLLTRMKGQNFNPNYTPTPGLEVYQFPWKLNSSHCNNVMISIWDVVEHSIPQQSTTETNPTNSAPLPDAQTIDTLKRANGLVIMIDPRSPSSISLAEQLICEAPEECQIVVFSNFYGEENVKGIIPMKLRSHIGRFSFIPGNLRTNLGLKQLAKWLQLPLLAAKRKMFADLFRAADNDLHSLEDEFYDDAKGYLSVQSAAQKIEASSPKMQSYSYLDQQNQSNISNSNSNSSVNYSEPSKLERPSVFAEPIKPKKRKKMPFFNNTGTSYNEDQNQGNDDDDDGFWSDDDGNGIDDLNNYDEVPSRKTNELRPNPMVQAPPPKKTMKQIIEENTIRVDHHEDVNDAHPTNKKRKKKVHHDQKVQQNNQEQVENDNFFSDSGDENKANEVPESNAANHEESTKAPQAKSKTVFTTTLVLEEEDEEDELEKPSIVNSHIVQASQQEIVDAQRNAEISAKEQSNEDGADEEGFWSDNEDENNSQEQQESINVNDDDDEIKPNPLVQNIKPRENNYQNVVPHAQEKPETQEKVKNDINDGDEEEEAEIQPNQQEELKPNPLVQPVKKRTNPYQNITPIQTQQQKPIEQEKPLEQQTEKSATNAPSTNDDDDFWNFEQPAVSQQVIAAAIQHKKKKVKKAAAAAAPEQAKPKERPLVIPKSQVAQRTITVGTSKLSYQQQQLQQQQQQQIPVIPTTDLFSDLNEPGSDFFPSQKPASSKAQMSQTTQKVDSASTTKTVRKRKRVVKSGAGSTSGYDAV